MKQLSIDEIGNKILKIEQEMGEAALSLWKLIKVTPEKWMSPDGYVWVVGVAGNKVIWYDEHAQHFAFSAYQISEDRELLAGKIAQSDVPDNMLALLTALRATQPR
jgi:hypothetical protein